MKVKTFLRITFGLLGSGITAINLVESIFIASMASPFWGILAFLGSEILTLIAIIFAYFNVARTRNLEEEL